MHNCHTYNHTQFQRVHYTISYKKNITLKLVSNMCKEVIQKEIKANEFVYFFNENSIYSFDYHSLPPR